MKKRKTYLSKDAHPLLKAFLEETGCEITEVATSGIVSDGISRHPDVFMCRMGCLNEDEVFFSPEYLESSGAVSADREAPSRTALSETVILRRALGKIYPADCLYNAACTGKYFIHKLSVTAPELLRAAGSRGMTMIDVPQGYSKCSVAVVDENTIITYDKGIAKACSAYPELTVLLITPGHIMLTGFDTGFIGGTSGRVGNSMIFNGDLSAHPDFEAMRRLVEARGLTLKYFPEYPLTDIGSII